MDTPWGRRVSHIVSGVTVILTLSSDPSSRKIVSRAYILYCFKVGIPNLDFGYMLGCQSVSYWYLWQYLLYCWWKEPQIKSVDTSWGCRVSHIVYRSLCLIYENLLSLGVFYQFVTQFMILLNNKLSNSAIQRYL